MKAIQYFIQRGEVKGGRSFIGHVLGKKKSVGATKVMATFRGILVDKNKEEDIER